LAQFNWPLTLLNDRFRISAALSPKTDTAGSFGSFDFNGATVDVTDDMVYGTPPVDNLLSPIGTTDNGNLATHSIFDTYFKEFEFQFNSAKTVRAFNVQDDEGKSIVHYSPTTSDELGKDFLYYVKFTVDVNNLDTNRSIHFDLYNTLICTDSTGQCDGNGDVDSDSFAPFSHDAQSGLGGDGDSGGGTGSQAPEPSSIALIGLGLVAFSFFQRRRTITSFKA
jgi:hypothetical protein